ncbi:Hypothetical_protein [Hexamita inflata]|uniref:Hypothetical_protein n=1 Tax=Hexamita inflata TaxID=28002 RepID=A0AA86NTS2_9EUKA|nr:Hypothetical protein HINF_LOCUS13513 [Hexamita inflata]
MFKQYPIIWIGCSGYYLGWCSIINQCTYLCGIQYVVYGICADDLEFGRLQCLFPFEFDGFQCVCVTGYMFNISSCVDVVNYLTNLNITLESNITSIQANITAINFTAANLRADLETRLAPTKNRNGGVGSQKIFYYVLVSVCAFIFLHVNCHTLKLRFNPSLGANHTKLKDVSNFSLKLATDIQISPNSMIIAMLLYLGPTNFSFCFRKYTCAIIQNATVQMLSELQQIMRIQELILQLIGQTWSTLRVYINK